MAHETQSLHLPITTITLVDIGRLERELEGLDNFFAQAAARKSGEAVAMPKTTKTFEEFVKQNDLQLLQKTDRERLAHFLEAVRRDAPVIHMSFAAEPSHAFLQKIIQWLRTEVHPQVLLQVGLQPSIAAGCVVRTTNKYFDFSMRKRFASQQAALIENIRTGAASGG